MRAKRGECKDEGDVKKEIRKRLAPFPNIHVDMPGATQYGISGRHDFLICQQGFFWTIEAKFGSNTPTDGQIEYAHNITAAGGVSFMINEKNLYNVAQIASCIQRGVRVIGDDFEQWRKP